MRHIGGNLRRAARALTLIELIFVVAIMLILFVFVLSMLRPRGSREYSQRKACNSNLGQIVKACTTYQEPNGDFFPAVWDGDAFRPMLSLAALYPAYVDNIKVFGCPQTQDRPKLCKMNVYGKQFYAFQPASSQETCSYFYDPLSHFRDVGPSQAMAADADGQNWLTPQGTPPPYPATWTRQPRKPNHDSGQNVMYFDGHVKWAESVYASDDPADNIFCPNGNWGADTDAYLWDGANARPAQAD